MNTVPDENNPRLVRAVCDSCGKLNGSACRPSKIDRTVQYLICPDCMKKQAYPKGNFEEGIMTRISYNAAPSSWSGITLEEATPEDFESVMRAKSILRRGLAKLN